MQRNTIFENVLLQSQLETQEYSFNNINIELHDNIGQLLSSTKLLLGMVAMELHSVPDALKTAEYTIGKAIQDLRILSRSISSEWLHHFNLIHNLRAEKDRINLSGEAEVQLQTEFEKLPLEPGSQVILSRVVHEAISNNIKCAHSKHIDINIRDIKKNVELSIEDDSTVCDIQSEKKEKHMLNHIQHRVKLLGGTINWKLTQHQGSALVISVPYKEQILE